MLCRKQLMCVRTRSPPTHSDGRYATLGKPEVRNYAKPRCGETFSLVVAVFVPRSWCCCPSVSPLPIFSVIGCGMAGQRWAASGVRGRLQGAPARALMLHAPSPSHLATSNIVLLFLSRVRAARILFEPRESLFPPVSPLCSPCLAAAQEFTRILLI